MRKTVRIALCGLIFQAGALVAAKPVVARDCNAKAVDLLKAASPNGNSVFRAIAHKAFFRTWIDCEDPQYALPTAVHESVHMMTADGDVYPLVGGGAVRRPPESTALFEPARIARQFRPSLFVTTYLRVGGSTSATDFRYLLDELNAYTHDLDTAVALDGLRTPDRQLSHRDGLAALMSFVAFYVKAAEADPDAWTALKHPDMKNAVSALWGQAERTMIGSCRITDIGTEDRVFLTKLCERGPQTALKRLLGRAPVCPKECLALPSTASRE
ncbi:hypothetical protein FV222_15725 [Methylobacterium sp. WL103]|uniref:hypothetical protein n=1 Tax=Methylobacterium sp. WL103 TaxID=2603891 RepID=UPI0011CB5F79|nr:hypothetical protein [Methylobacterium sp. WL103]TXM97599.1 hypothetical protein FV222_15725 [Methylobacterium sp. WL103]